MVSSRRPTSMIMTTGILPLVPVRRSSANPRGPRRAMQSALRDLAEGLSCPQGRVPTRSRLTVWLVMMSRVQGPRLRGQLPIAIGAQPPVPRTRTLAPATARTPCGRPPRPPLQVGTPASTLLLCLIPAAAPGGATHSPSPPGLLPSSQRLHAGRMQQTRDGHAPAATTRQHPRPQHSATTPSPPCQRRRRTTSRSEPAAAADGRPRPARPRLPRAAPPPCAARIHPPSVRLPSAPPAPRSTSAAPTRCPATATPTPAT